MRRYTRLAAVLRILARQPVLMAGAALAAISACVVPPDAAYAGYIDTHTMGLLFALLLATEGLKEAGALSRVGQALLSVAHSSRALAGVLVGLCFFSAMVMTNDVALITFVPLALSLGAALGEPAIVARVVILQTIAANIGAMLTPLGSPQNLFLSNHAGFGFAEVARLTWPYVAVCGLLLALSVAALPRCREGFRIEAKPPVDKVRLPVYGALFCGCIACVAGALSLKSLLFAAVPVVAVVDRRMFGRVDYALLLTFCVFFVFVGNLGRIPEVHRVLERSVKDHLLATGILSSQIVSNVPATLLLASCTENAAALLIAVNLGGLGTLIASMASLISYRFVEAAKTVRSGAYLRSFTAWNVAFLALLTALAAAL